MDKYSAVSDMGLRDCGGVVGSVLRSLRPRSDDVYRNFDGVHPGRRQCPGTSLSTRTGICLQQQVRLLGSFRSMVNKQLRPSVTLISSVRLNGFFGSDRLFITYHCQKHDSQKYNQIIR